MEYEAKPKKRSIVDFEKRSQDYEYPHMNYGGYLWGEAEWFDPRDGDFEEAWVAASGMDDGYIEVYKGVEYDNWDWQVYSINEREPEDERAWFSLMEEGQASSREEAMDAGIAYYEKNVKRASLQTQEKISICKPIEKEAQSEQFPLPDDFPDRLRNALPYFEEVESITYSVMHLGAPVKESSLAMSLFEFVSEAKDALVEYIALLDERMPKEEREMAPPNEFWSEGNKEKIEKEAWSEADNDATYYEQERNRDRLGDSCAYLKTTRGEDRDEYTCKNPDSETGECNEEDCPLDESSKREQWSAKKSIIKKTSFKEGDEVEHLVYNQPGKIVKVRKDDNGKDIFSVVLDSEPEKTYVARESELKKKADYMNLGNEWHDEYALPGRINQKIRNAISKDLQPLRDKTYFEDFTEATDIVAEALNKNGFEGDKIMTGIYTGDEGKMDVRLAQNAGLHMQWYRMPSGKYEFNVYVS